MKVLGLGMDVTEISRFRSVLSEDRQKFIMNTFTQAEQKYCLSHKDPAPHFAGMFAAKEAARKASGELLSPLSAVEIRHEKDGKPEVWIKGKRSLSLFVSISHT